MHADAGSYRHPLALRRGTRHICALRFVAHRLESWNCRTSWYIKSILLSLAKLMPQHSRFNIHAAPTSEHLPQWPRSIRWERFEGPSVAHTLRVHLFALQAPLLTIEDEGKTLTMAESGAIVDFVLKQYGNGKFQPTTDAWDVKAMYTFWLHYAEVSRGSLALFHR